MIGRKSKQQAPDDESGRESRLKLILLAVALVLVAGYAASVTDMGNLAAAQMRSLLGSGLPVLPILGAIVALAAAAAAFVLLRRRWPAGLRSKPAEPAATVAGRREFQKTLAAQIESHAKSGRQLAVHILDIDRFHLVNEALGEAEGDAFLQLLAERLLVLVNHPERLARIGDDEFAIIQPETGGARHAEIYARRIEETVKDACAQIARQARPGASIGIAVFPEHGDSAANLLHNASLALHAAKKSSGESLRVFSREIEMALDTRLQTEKMIGDGLHQGWFELHFQPQYDLLSRRLTGFEALVRMNHPEQGELLPETFLAAAEESGLIQPLGEWIFREALSTASTWPNHLNLSINVSPAQFLQADIAGAVTSALSKAGFDGSRLRLEISEAVLPDESGVVGEQLRRLKSRGVTIVIDDFGLVSSQLKGLSRLACDAVKLDRSLIKEVGAEPEAENLVRGLIGTAKSFDLAILAEGIERAEQVHFLMAHDCRHVQGFLFGRPTRASELGAIIAKDMRKATDGEEGGSSDAARSAA